MTFLRGISRRSAQSCWDLLVPSSIGTRRTSIVTRGSGYPLIKSHNLHGERAKLLTCWFRSDPLASQVQTAGLHSSSAASAVPGPRNRRSPAAEPSKKAAEVQTGVGTVYVQCTKNNTICTLVDIQGLPLAWASAGSCGFKNARKKSTQVSQTVAETLLEKIYEKGFKEVRIVMKGLGYGKQTAVRALTKSRLKIMEIHEQTAVPHNGCRAPKRRRI